MTYEEFQQKAERISGAIWKALEDGRIIENRPFKSVCTSGLIRALALHLADREFAEQEGKGG